MGDKARRVPPLNAVRAFEAVARLGGIAAAARELHVSASAVSQQLRVLEGWLGVPLLVRGPNGVALTAKGRAYQPALSAALDQMAEATETLFGNAPARPLRVSCLPSLAAEWLVPRLAAFSARHPDLKIVLSTSTELVDFDREDIDLAIRFGRGDYRDLNCERLMAERLAPVCHPALLAAGAEIQALAGLTLLHDQSARELGKPGWRRWLDAAGLAAVDAGQGPRFTDSHMTIAAARRGQGVMLGRYVLVADSLAEGSLTAPFGRWIDAGLAYYLVFPAHRPQRPAARKFCRWLRKTAGAMRPPAVSDPAIGPLGGR